MALIDTLSIRFEAEAGRALTNVQGLENSLKKLSDVVGTLSKKNVTLGIKQDTGANIRSFASSIKELDLDRLQQFGEITKGFKSIALGIGSATANNLRSFNAALAGFDVAKFAWFSATAKDFPGIKVSITGATGNGLKMLADGVNTINIDKFREFANVASGFNGIRVGLGEKGGEAIWRFAMAINALDITKLREFSQIAAQMTGLKTGITQTSAINLAMFGASVNSLDLDRLRELASIDFSNLERLGVAATQIKSLSSEIAKLQGAADKVDKARGSVDKLNKSLSETSGETKEAARGANKMGGALSRLAAPVKNLFRSIGRIAFYRAIRSAIKAVTQGLSEGIKNLYYWSQAWGTSFAPAMDRLATATRYLRNGFASMFSPLIEYAIPIIDALIDKFVDFFNFVQEGIAQLTGAPTWNRALKVPTTYAEALDDASASAKELKNQLMGFDELNVLNTPNNSGRNKDKDAEDYASMFELVETAAGNNFESIGEKLADALNKVFENPEKWGEKGETLANTIITAFNNALDFFSGINWTNVAASFSTFLSTFQTKIAEWIINEQPLSSVIDAVTNAVCGIIEGIDPIELLKSFAKLFMSLTTTLPSVLLATLSSVIKIYGTILNKLGFEEMGNAALTAADALTEARKKYDAWNKQSLDVVFDVMDNGFESYVPNDLTHNNGGSLTPDASAVYQQDREVTIKLNIKTLLNGVAGTLSEIKQKISDWVEDIKKVFGVVSIVFKLVLKKFSESDFAQDLQEWANEFTAWWKEHPTPISWVMDLFSEERMEELKTKIKEWFEKYPAPIDWIMEKLGRGEKWQEFKAKIKEWFKKYPAPIDWVMEKLGRGEKWQEFKAKIKEWFKKYPAPIDWIMEKTGRGTKWQEFKDSIKEWFKKYPTPISWFLQKTGIGEKVKDAWDKTKTWFEEHPFPVFAAVESLGDKIKEKWNEFVNSDFVKNLKIMFTIAAPALDSTLKEMIRKWWTETVVPWWENNTIVGKLVLKLKSPEFRQQFDNWWNNEVIPWFRDKVVNFNIKTPHFTWVGGDPNPLTWVNPSNRPHIQVDWYAQGGFLNPSSYSLAGLGENGVPEILGTVGGRSAVAGGAEITGIREAIYEQGQREENLLRTLITAVNNKDLQLVANSSTGRWVNRALNAYAGVTG